MLFIIPDALNIKSVIGFSSLYTIHSNNYDDGIYWAFFHMNIYDMVFNLKLELLIKSIDNRIILLSIFVIWYVSTMWKYQTRKTCLSNFRFKCDTMLYLYIYQTKQTWWHVFKRVEKKNVQLKLSCWIKRIRVDFNFEQISPIYNGISEMIQSNTFPSYIRNKCVVVAIRNWINIRTANKMYVQFTFEYFFPRWFVSYEVLTYATLEFQNAIYSHT